MHTENQRVRKPRAIRSVFSCFMQSQADRPHCADSPCQSPGFRLAFPHVSVPALPPGFLRTVTALRCAVGASAESFDCAAPRAASPNLVTLRGTRIPAHAVAKGPGAFKLSNTPIRLLPFRQHSALPEQPRPQRGAVICHQPLDRHIVN